MGELAAVPCLAGGAMFQGVAEAMMAMARPIRGTGWLVDVATTGAAGLLKMALWAEPGASDNVLGERWTYAQQHTDDLIGRQPPEGRYSRVASALAMSAAAYAHARRIAFERGLHGRPVMGVAMTAAVSTGRERSGDNTCRVAVRTSEGFWLVDATMDKAASRGQGRSVRRLEEGVLCDLLTLMTMLSVMGFEVPPLAPGWGVSSPQLVAREDGALVLRPEVMARSPLESGASGMAGSVDASGGAGEAGEVGASRASGSPGDSGGAGRAEASPFYKVVMPDQTVVPVEALDPARFILLPGSFDPLHHGHEQIAAMAREQTGKDVIFQITARHPAKGVIPTGELLRRAGQLQFRWPVVLFDGEGLYAQKAERVPGMAMLIGVDVVYGLQELRYYGGDKGLRRAMFEALARLGTTFLVAGREVEGHYESLGDVPVPGNFAHLFRPLGGRVDVSSTQLRGAGG